MPRDRSTPLRALARTREVRKWLMRVRTIKKMMKIANMVTPSASHGLEIFERAKYWVVGNKKYAMATAPTHESRLNISLVTPRTTPIRAEAVSMLKKIRSNLFIEIKILCLFLNYSIVCARYQIDLQKHFFGPSQRWMRCFLYQFFGLCLFQGRAVLQVLTEGEY